MEPREYRSDSTEARVPPRISGAAWAMVPVMLVVAVVAPWTAAIPKSDSFDSPKRSSRTFSGLTSRCSTSAPWAAASASANWTPIASTSGHGNGPWAFTWSPSVPPGRCSMTRYGAPSLVEPAS